jgi:cytochrome c556
MLAAGVGSAAVRPADVSFKEFLPDADLVKLVEDSTTFLKDATKSSGSFNQKAKDIEGEAILLLLYAQAAVHSDQEETTKKAAVLQEAALALMKAAQGKKYDDAKKQVEVIAKFKSLKADGPKGREVDIAKTVPIKRLMEQVGKLDLKISGNAKGSYKRLTASEWNAKGKTDEVALNSYRMAAFVTAMTAYAPEQDPDPKETDKKKKNQTKKNWLNTTTETREATMDMVAAAKAKKQDDFKKGLNRMISACNSCHDIFRGESD